MELVAHRAGNVPGSMAAAAAAAHTVELDVHLFRGALEVRHSKVLWPFRIYWERGVGIVHDERPVDLATVVDRAPADTHLWIDLKGYTGRLPRRVLDELGDRRPITLSCRSWWALRSARRSTGVRTFRSVGNQVQLWVALRIDHPDGIVLHERLVTPEVVERLRTRCSRIAAWGVHDATRAEELRELGLAALIIDEPDLIAVIRSRG